LWLYNLLTYVNTKFNNTIAPQKKHYYEKPNVLTLNFYLYCNDIDVATASVLTIKIVNTPVNGAKGFTDEKVE